MTKHAVVHFLTKNFWRYTWGRKLWWHFYPNVSLYYYVGFGKNKHRVYSDNIPYRTHIDERFYND